MRLINWQFRKYGWQLLPGAVVGIGVSLLFGLGGFIPLEELAYGLLFHLRGAQPWDERLVLITIDDPSIQQLGRFPWSRQTYSQLLQVLRQADPAVVAIALVFSESSPDDRALAQSMAQLGRVVLAQANDGASLHLSPVPMLQAEAIAVGHVLHGNGWDGMARQVPIVVDHTPALGLATVKAYSLVQENVDPEPLDGQLWINWAGAVQSLPQYSFADVIQHKVASNVFRHKIVLVGVTASMLSPVVTPYDREPIASGLHLHAAVVDTLLKRNQLHKPDPAWFPLILLVSGSGLSLCLSNLRLRSRLWCWFSLCLGWLLCGLIGFSANLWLPIAMPILLISGITIATGLCERWHIDLLLRRQIQYLWQIYRPTLVIPQGATSQSMGCSRPDFRTFGSLDKLAELAEQLGRSQATQAAIAHHLPVALLAANLDGGVWFCNAVATQWLHIQPGDHLPDRLVPHWLDAVAWEQALALAQAQEFMPPRVIHQGDRWYELTLDLLPSTLPLEPASEPKDIMLMVADITLQKQAEVALKQRVQELDALSQLKDDFLSTVSHELRTPLTNIKMAIQLLKLARSPEASAKYLDILQVECNREVELINDLLDLQRLESGVPTFDWQPIEIATWLPTVIAPFYDRAATHHQTLQLELVPQLPTLVSDASSLERIVSELVNNACKYTPPGEVIQVSADACEGGFNLVVRNGGVNISQQDLAQVFEKFYRVPQVDRWKQGGTGLGLSLIKTLVEHLGGAITATSESGQVTFTVSLPTGQAFEHSEPRSQTDLK